MFFKLLQCSELAAAMHVGPSYCLVTRITQFCQGGCNIYCRLWQANTGSCRCFRLFSIFSDHILFHCSTRRSQRSCAFRQSSHARVSAVFACLLPGRPFTFSTSSAVWEVWIGLTQTLILVLLIIYIYVYFKHNFTCAHTLMSHNIKTTDRSITVVEWNMMLGNLTFVQMLV